MVSVRVLFFFFDLMLTCLCDGEASLSLSECSAPGFRLESVTVDGLSAGVVLIAAPCNDWYWRCSLVMPEDPTGSFSERLAASEIGPRGAIGKFEGIGDNTAMVMLEEGPGADGI